MKSERIKIRKILIFAVLFAVLAFISVGCTSATTIHVPGDYAKIQWAVDNATAGDTIIVDVSGGPYYENVEIDKSLILKGINYPVVNASRNGNAITIVANDCTITGFEIVYSGTSWDEAGIKIESGDNIISSNTISDSGTGIWLYQASNNTISNNSIHSNKCAGICLDESVNNTIIGCHSYSNDCCGIFLASSNNNTLNDNNASSSKNSNGISVWFSDENKLCNNTANSNNKSGIYLYYSNNNTLINNDASDNDVGIRLGADSSDNEITKNNAYPNRVSGIQIEASENRIYMNNFNGINISEGAPQIEFSPDVTVEYYDHLAAIAYCGFKETAGDSGFVTIEAEVSSVGTYDYHSCTFYVLSYGYYDFEIVITTIANYESSALKVSSPSATSTLEIFLVEQGQAFNVYISAPRVPENFLNSTEEITYTYKGNNYTNYLGNYWSNYEEEYPNATEIDSTGIWDTPYSSTHLGEDNYPLVEPWENYFKPVENQLPIANFTYSPEKPIVNQSITFNASTSYDPDGTIVKYEWSFGEGTNGIGKIVTHSYSSAGDYSVNLTVTDDDGATNTTSKLIKVYPKVSFFDTGPGTYPSIFSTHNGTIKPNQTITVSQLYTYPCSGTGGHTEYITIYNESGTIAEGYWEGYSGDWHNILFDYSFTLEEGEPYNYTIRTGSYPQIHHTDNLSTPAGFITCSEFVDANGKRYTDWIPAIRLE